MIITQLALRTASLTALRTFYNQRLDLPITDVRSSKFTIDIGKTCLTFSEATGGTDPFYHFAVNIPRNQFTSAKEWLANRVELLRTEDGEDEFTFEFMNAKAVYFIDPAGNIVELIARQNLSNDSAQPFCEDEFLEISEIGLPVREVLSTARELETNLDIPLYEGYSEDFESSSQFTCMGDDHALLILVPIERPWFPTETQEAETHPTEVVLTGDRATQYEFSQLPYQLSIVTS